MSDVSGLWARIQALGQIIFELKARVRALEDRIAALEQSGAARWFQ